MEKELSNVVYIFASPDLPGIMFYDRSPDDAVAKFAGSLPGGKFLTDIDSISSATWDKEINESNSVQLIRVREGSYNVITIMVSIEQLDNILQSIKNSKDETRIVIDIGDNRIDSKISDNKINYDEIFEKYNSNKIR